MKFSKADRQRDRTRHKQGSHHTGWAVKREKKTGKEGRRRKIRAEQVMVIKRGKSA